MDETHARELLNAERARLSTITGEIDGTPDDADTKYADRGADAEDRTRDLGLLEHFEEELAEIDAALKRLDEGTYGRCDVCGRPIPDERLEANPTARFDAEHEATVERGGLGR